MAPHDAGLPLRGGPQQPHALGHGLPGAARFAYNFTLALVKSRLAERERIREVALCQGLSIREADALARSVPVPWSLPALRREWNLAKDVVAPWWRQNPKEAANTGLYALACALKAWSDSKAGGRKGPRVGFPVFKKRSARRSCRFSTGSFGVVDTRHIHLPRIGIVRTKEQTAALGALMEAGAARILSATLTEMAGRRPQPGSSRGPRRRQWGGDAKRAWRGEVAGWSHQPVLPGEASSRRQATG